MNIFVLDLDPRRCASYHCDFHVGRRESLGEARSTRVVCASARTAGGLAQRSVEIDRVHALENAVGARLFDVPNIEIDLHP